MPQKRATFGSVDQLPSGRYRARYTGPDRKKYAASITFESERHADAFLAKTRTAISNETWVPPNQTKAAPLTFGEYAQTWLANRTLETRTRELYDQLLRRRLLPTFESVPITEITSDAVDAWYSGMGTKTPTARAHAYGLLRTILGTAVDRRVIDWNPCRIRGAGQTKAAKKTRPATLGELAAITAALPDKYRMMAQLACWCSLRFGEITELRRRDIDLKADVIRVRRAVVVTKASGMEIKAPKSAAGIRDVTIPGHLLDDLKTHLRVHAQSGPDGLIFPSASGQHIAASSLHKVFRTARASAGRPDLSFHDLRHTGQTYAAQAGANLRELMARAGQSSPGAALRYLHEVDGRQKEIADRLATFATATTNVTPISSKKSTTKRGRPAR